MASRSIGAGEARALALEMFDRNGWIHLSLVAATAAAAIGLGPGWLALYPAALLTFELSDYFLGWTPFDPERSIQRQYTLSAYFNEAPYGEGIDYGFNFYDGDYTKPRVQAQVDKFEFAAAALGLEPGMRVIDIGCGCGDWLAWLRSQGMEVVGVNLSGVQVELCRSRGLDVIWTNWKDIHGDPALRERLYGRFDAVTFWDTIEHYVPYRYRSDVEMQDRVYTDVFALAHRLLKPDSPSQRVFVSCLHYRHAPRDLPMGLRKLRTLAYHYLLATFHNGNYPDGPTDQLVRDAKPFFRLENRKDTTLDYYMTSVLEPAHFGRHRFRWTLQRLGIAALILLTDHTWPHRVAWFLFMPWMWQFDGEDIDRSDMVHWWLTLRHDVGA